MAKKKHRRALCSDMASKGFSASLFPESSLSLSSMTSFHPSIPPPFFFLIQISHSMPCTCFSVIWTLAENFKQLSKWTWVFPLFLFLPLSISFYFSLPFWKNAAMLPSTPDQKAERGGLLCKWGFVISVDRGEVTWQGGDSPPFTYFSITPPPTLAYLFFFFLDQKVTHNKDWAVWKRKCTLYTFLCIFTQSRLLIGQLPWRCVCISVCVLRGLMHVWEVMSWSDCVLMRFFSWNRELCRYTVKKKRSFQVRPLLWQDKDENTQIHTRIHREIEPLLKYTEKTWMPHPPTHPLLNQSRLSSKESMRDDGVCYFSSY